MSPAVARAIRLCAHARGLKMPAPSGYAPRIRAPQFAPLSQKDQA